jgi:hypothetical protein
MTKPFKNELFKIIVSQESAKALPRDSNGFQERVDAPTPDILMAPRLLVNLQLCQPLEGQLKYFYY